MSLPHPDSLPSTGRSPRRLPALPALALTVALAVSAAPIRAATTPTLRAEPEPIEATETLNWSFQLFVDNPLDVGLYLDSLSCEVESLDLPANGGGRRETRNLDFLLHGAGRGGIDGSPGGLTVSAGQSGTIQVTLPATSEHARLTFVLRLHDGAKKSWRVTHTVEANPGPFTREHPSQFATANGRKVEYVLVRAATTGPAPAVLFVHGSGSSARQFLSLASTLATRGYTTMLVSMPGYGQSEGTPDFAGPATVAALDAALDVLARSEGVDSTRIAIWGISRGAGAALETAARRGSLKAAIGQSGAYDLWAVWRAAKARHVDDLAADIERMAGSDSAAWRQRSAATMADRLHCPVLLIHAEDDGRTPIAQARGFAGALEAHGATVETKFLAKGGHPVSPRDAMSAAMPFLKRTLAP